MKWETITLETADTEKDALGNTVEDGTYTKKADTKARTTPWTMEEENLLGLDVTKNQQRMAVPLPYNTVREATHIKSRDIYLRIIEAHELAPRWTLITTEARRTP